jgi:hypothetical protein
VHSRSELIGYIEALTAEGGTGNRLVVSGGRGWAVLSGALGEAFVDLEVATSAHLPEEAKLSEAQLGSLGRAGFIPPIRSSPRRRRPIKLDGPERAGSIADELVVMMGDLYGAEPDGLHLALALEDASEVENPELLKAMRKLSRVRTHEARVELYQQLLNATLILAVDGEQPRQIDKLGKWMVYGVFTDGASVRHYDPRVTPHRTLYGHELFPMLMKTEVGALKINPDGMIGGELYRNELETLAKAVGRFRR